MGRFNRWALGGLFLACLLLAACEDETVSIGISPQKVQLLEAGATAKLTVKPVDRTGAPVEEVLLAWSSSDPAVASVDTQGTIRAVSTGEAEISAEVGELKESIPVTVSLLASLTLDVTQIVLTPEKASVHTNLKVLDQKGDPWPGKREVLWSSGDERVAAVVDGVITSTGKGSTRVTVSFKGLSADVVVTTSGPPLEPVTSN